MSKKQEILRKAYIPHLPLLLPRAPLRAHATRFWFMYGHQIQTAAFVRFNPYT